MAAKGYLRDDYDDDQGRLKDPLKLPPLAGDLQIERIAMDGAEIIFTAGYRQ